MFYNLENKAVKMLGNGSKYIGARLSGPSGFLFCLNSTLLFIFNFECD